MAAAGKQRPQFTMREISLAADYYDEMDFRKRELINEVLQMLAAEKVVDLAWARFRNGQEVEKVYLNIEAVDKAYGLTGKVAKDTKLNSLRVTLESLADHPWPWVRSWWTEVDGALGQRKNPGLKLDDPAGYRDLVLVLNALPSLEEDVPKRLFSQAVLQDSKRFEQAVQTRLIGLLRRYVGVEYERNEDYLDSVGLVEQPRLVLIQGPLVFRAGEGTTDIGSLPGGLGLSTATVKVLQIVEVKAKSILCVENLTSYYQVALSNLGGDNLIVHTAGFPNRSVQQLLRKLADYLDSIPQRSGITVYHWGDIDYGGIQIFKYIKREFFPEVKPYRMDLSTYESQLNNGIPFGDEYAVKLQRLMQEPSCTQWRSLIQAMLHHRIRIEQESVQGEVLWNN